MITLAIETSNPSACPGEVALARDGRIIAGAVVGGEGAEGLMAVIDRMASGHGLRARDIGRVAVSLGPGGYTSVRIAASAAKMIALATGCACIGVPTALVARARAKLDGLADGPLGVALASKGEACYIVEFPGGAGAAGGRIVDAGGVGGLTVERLLVDRFFPGAMRAACGVRGIELKELRLGAGACVAASEGQASVDPADIAPIYPRPPEAVRLWRERTGG